MIKELTRWVEILSRYDRIYIGFSGGLDSTVLLRALASESRLTDKIHAIHINHGLSRQADAWQIHCQQICQQWNISYQAIKVSINREANIEETARNARYNAFAKCIQTTNQCLLTAHHQDDQAETLLLHLFRGAGVKGLAGISETSAFSQGTLHRPLLAVSREALVTYAKSNQLVWIEDESNANVQFSRNFIRQQVLPLLQTKWPGVAQNLARTSELCRQAQLNLEALAEIDCSLANPKVLSLDPLQSLNEERLSNVLRLWLQKNSARPPNYVTFQRLIHEVILADRDANPEVCWDNVVVKRFHRQLFLLVHSDVGVPLSISWDSFPAPVPVSGIGIVTAQLVSKGIKLYPGDRIEIRFRRGGELFELHQQTKSLKKLMQEWGIPTWLRDKTPLLYLNGELAAVIGYAISDRVYGENTEWCYEIVISRSLTSTF